MISQQKSVLTCAIDAPFSFLLLEQTLNYYFRRLVLPLWTLAIENPAIENMYKYAFQVLQ